MSTFYSQMLQRIKKMRDNAEAEYKLNIESGQDGWIEKKRFLARYRCEVGVRPQVSDRYFDDIVDGGWFILHEDGKKFKPLME